MLQQEESCDGDGRRCVLLLLFCLPRLRLLPSEDSSLLVMVPLCCVLYVMQARMLARKRLRCCCCAVESIVVVVPASQPGKQWWSHWWLVDGARLPSHSKRSHFALGSERVQESSRHQVAPLISALISAPTSAKNVIPSMGREKEGKKERERVTPPTLNSQSVHPFRPPSSMQKSTLTLVTNNNQVQEEVVGIIYWFIFELTISWLAGVQHR